MPSGETSSYTTELASKVCEGLFQGMTLREVCRTVDIGHSTVLGWVKDDREGFADQYARAREVGYHIMADELLEVADDGQNDWMERLDDEGKANYVLNGEHVQRSRLRLDTRKWLLSKALPKIYGDKQEVKHTGDLKLMFDADDKDA